jgi:chemotaxis protein histidine kinase CheA
MVRSQLTTILAYVNLYRHEELLAARGAPIEAVVQRVQRLVRATKRRLIQKPFVYGLHYRRQTRR